MMWLHYTSRQEAATHFRRGPPVEVGDGSGSGDVVAPVTVELSPSQIQAINESPLASPNMWMQLAGVLRLPQDSELSRWEEMQLHPIWDS